MLHNFTLCLAFILSLMIHLIMLTLFYISPSVDVFTVPKMTRVSFLPIDMNQLLEYAQENLLEVGSDDRNVLGIFEGVLLGDHETRYLQHFADRNDLELLQDSVQMIEASGQMSVELSTQRKVVRLYYPRYPRWAKRAGLQSDVLVRFQILKNGAVGQLLFEKMSGNPKLDALGLRAVRRWRFESLPDETDASQWGTVKLKFRLT
jgi:TonB family protein